MKTAAKIFAGLFILTLTAALTYYGYHQWRVSSVYEETITVKAYYMKYSCGDCSLDMKVEAVDNPKFDFVVGQEIFPTPRSKKFGELCDFIGSIGYESSTGPHYVEESFTLVGQLHKHSRELPWSGCAEAPFFTVDKIKYGTHGKWMDF